MIESALMNHPYLASTRGSFRMADYPTTPDKPNRDKHKKKLKKYQRDLDELQRLLYAQGKNAVLIVFQAMDAAGKDSTIRAVFNKVDPNGCHVSSFKQPSKEELAHDFLWRTTLQLPEKGHLGVFNRSYYEEVLVVRVHPEYLSAQNLPPIEQGRLWQQRYRAIADHERHLAESGTVILKFWLNVSRDEQARRFISRIDDPEKRFKFSLGDVRERALWSRYMDAYQDAIAATSKPWAPWYAIPADDKPYMRMTVANIVRDTLRGLDMQYPEAEVSDDNDLEALRATLESEIGAATGTTSE